MTRNEIFACAVDYLYKEGKIVDQSELSAKTGINETTISRILNNRVRKPSDDSLRRLNATFGNIFNPRWLRGESEDMLIEKALPDAQKDSDTNKLLSGIENLLDISSKQIKENEELRRQLQSSIDDLNNLIAELKSLCKVTRYDDGILMVAENDEEMKK